MNKSYIFAAVLIAGAGIGYYVLNPSTPEPMPIAADGEPDTTALVAVTLPEILSEQAQLGKRMFDAKCAACHNVNGAGTDGLAPPLIHVIYEPSHHGDESFQRAVANGVQGHHWPFGNMPPVDGLTRGDVQMIVTYIRELQRENGIH